MRQNATVEGANFYWDEEENGSLFLSFSLIYKNSLFFVWISKKSPTPDDDERDNRVTEKGRVQSA